MASEESERSRRARIAGLSRSVQADSGAAISAPARRAFLDGFYDRTDPTLPEAERRRQEEAALKLHMTQLSQKASLARQRASRAVSEAINAEAAVIAAREDAV